MHRVVVTGVGVVSPNGIGRRAFGEAIVTGFGKAAVTGAASAFATVTGAIMGWLVSNTTRSGHF